MKPKRFPETDGWCFALVNGRLAEIWWRKKKSGEREVVAHGYVERKKNLLSNPLFAFGEENSIFLDT